MTDQDRETPVDQTANNDAYRVEIRGSLADVEAAQWNALNADGNPFVRHEFLYGLEVTDCLGDASGWYPRYALVFDGDALIAGCAAYLKTNSYGEFVFDWAWADAYQRHGLPYYPKLVVGIPFTPATGPRLLIRADQPWEACARLLARVLEQYAQQEECSSVHHLFVTEREHALLTSDDDSAHLPRLDCQYHWRNPGYQCFDDFLAGCTSKRRKTLRRERRHVSDAGLRLERRLGNSLTSEEWLEVHELYASTFDRKWGNPWLTAAFFQRMGDTFGDSTLIVFAFDPADDEPEKPVACSVMFQGGSCLYGRYWGCRREYHSLHFEACYYQGIEHCIENNIERFEPGAQGEHKITRGFEPTLTRSAHAVFHPGFRDAVAGFLDEERDYVRQRCEGLTDLLPFKAQLADPETD